MTEKDVALIAKQFADLQFTNYLIVVLTLLVSLLFAAVMFYFRKDMEETKKSIVLAEELSRKNASDILLALNEIQHNRKESDKVLRILSVHTGANTGI